MATIFEDTFNTYDDGDLNTQGSWSGSTAYDVEVGDATNPEGADSGKQVKCSAGAAAEIVKTGTGQGDGKISWYMKCSTTVGAGGKFLFVLSEAGTDKILAGFRDDDIVSCGDAAWQVHLNGFTANQWYLTELEWEGTGDTYRIRIDGGTWSDWLTPCGSATWTTLDRVEFYHYGGGEDIYIDYIAEEPFSAPSVADVGIIFGCNQ